MVSLVYIRNHGEWYFNKAIVGGRTLWANMNVGDVSSLMLRVYRSQVRGVQFLLIWVLGFRFPEP